MRIRLKPTREFGKVSVKENDDSDYKSMMDLGFEDPKWEMEEIRDVFYNIVGDESSYRDSTFSKLVTDDDFEFSLSDQHGSSTTVNITVNGGAYVTDLDVDSILNEIIDTLYRGGGHEKRPTGEAYTEEEISSALNSIRFDDYIEVEYGNYPFRVKSLENFDSVSVEAEIDEDQIDVIVNVDDLWNEFSDAIR